ncbi:MAG TPA: hypothetical protein VLZ83_05105 [Edaphocola sp.]|nr:hypothetical protein [Edaphocola sp.]
MAQSIKIKEIKHLTHDVLKIVLEKPEGLIFTPGQAADFAINKPGWETEWRSFTFTSHPSDKDIEFNIKTYTDHNGVTNELLTLKEDDEILIGDVYGDIEYKGEGVFIAGGAGITPFIAILKDLQKENKLGNNKLIFANKTSEDIIQKELLQGILGDNFINVLSDEKVEGYEKGYISAELIKKNIEDFNTYFYLCGPPPMMSALEKDFELLGIPEEKIVKEGF